MATGKGMCADALAMDQVVDH